MANGAAPWELVRLLPNLRLPSVSDDTWTDAVYVTGRETLTLRSTWAAIVPNDDPRLLAFLETHPTGKRLVESFIGPYGQPVAPAALITRQDAPIPRRTDAIAAYRNAVAACFTLRGHAAALTEQPTAGRGAWSDLFDFHPAEVDKGDSIQIHSAALLHMMGKPKQLAFAPSPYVDTVLDLRHCDQELSMLLSKAWHRAYVRRRERLLFRPVFRSLEIAFLAAAIPVKNVGSLYDFGLTVSLWVASLEALLWPVNRSASQENSVRFLSATGLDDRRLEARRFGLKYGSRTVRANYLQKACSLLYRARNAFMHGDAFTARNLQPWPTRPDANLIQVAPIVYRQALLRRLYDFFSKPEATDWADIDSETIASWFTEDVFENALLNAFGLEDLEW